MKHIELCHRTEAGGRNADFPRRLTGALRGLVSALAFVACGSLIFWGCAGPVQEIKPAGEKQKAGIEKITVMENGRDVLIEATEAFTYTAFKLTEPDRLIIDFPGVDVKKVSAPIEVNNDFITAITVASYGDEASTPIARVEIGLKQGIANEIRKGDGSILVRLNQETAPGQDITAVVEAIAGVPAAGLAAAPATEPSLPQGGEAKEESASTAAKSSDVAASPGEAKEPRKADKLLAIEAMEENGATVIRIAGNGAIGDFNAIEIDGKASPRLVVDVWNVGSSIPKKVLGINTPHFKRVRVGEYPNKTRLVFDAKNKALPKYAIEKAGDYLVITAGNGNAKKTQEAVSKGVAAPEPLAVVQPPPPPPALLEPKADEYARLTGVDFKRMTGNAQLTLTLSGKVDYKLTKNADDAGFVLDIAGAVISGELERTLDASALKTPVASISSFHLPSETVKTVRIVVKLKEKTAYDVLQEGEVIRVVFPLEAAPQTIAKKADVKSDKETAVGTSEPEGAKASRKISLDFKDADIGNILRLMAEVSNLNIIAGEDVKGKVSLRLVDVPWEQAFDIILKTNGLGRTQEGNVVRIMPIMKIKQESEEAAASKKAKEKLEDLEIKLLSVNYSKASDLEPQVKSLLSDRGTLSTEVRTNTLIIKDTPSSIKNAVDMVRKLDTPTPQVLIEARIVEAQSNFARDLGVQWGVTGYTTRGTEEGNRYATMFGSTSTSPPAKLLDTRMVGSSGRISEQPNYAVSLPASGTAGPLGALGFSFGKLTGDPLLLDLRISAGEKTGKTKVVSRPRITTLDNKEAKISQGDSVPFETVSSSGTQTAFIDATLDLVVTPHITPDGSVAMKIKATRNSIGSFRSASGTPSISKKEAMTEIIVKDGETAVIGGIVVADKSDNVSGIPYLQDIPLLGWMFKNKSISDNQTELLIFITPSIVKQEGNIALN
ncbi:MAG: type IV pilus secretin PilQ [Deltaproteobacteria bacterium]|nr:type IV pilus secretin PilQ [Deltaproteobacteria bacterium]